MIRSLVPRLLVLMACLLVAERSSGQQGRELLIYNIQLVDVETGEIKTNAAVLIREDQIAEVGSYNDLKKKVRKEIQLNGGGCAA